MKSSKLLLSGIVFLALAVPSCDSQAAKDSAEAGKSGSEASASKAEVAAYIGDKVITFGEVDDLLGSQLTRVRQEEYDLRSRAVQQLVLQRLLDQEADAAGLTLQEFTEKIDSAAPKPTAQEINEAYDRAKATDTALQAKNEEQGKKLVQQRLELQKLQEHRNDYIDELMARADVRVMLEPPRMDVNIPEGEPSKGPKNAPITIVEFADFQCGYCKRAEPVVAQLLQEYGDKIRFVYRDYALNFHPRAEPAAVAARCAGDQGKYWEYHSNLMTVNGSLDDSDLAKRAQTLSLDMAAFNGCLESKRHNEAVQAGFADGSALGVTGTPTFFINGRMLVGAQPYAALQAVIEDELKRTKVQTQ